MDPRDMIQTIKEDDDGNTAIEFDEEGIDYLITGLEQLRAEDIGGVMTTPAVWTRKAPWWRFWNRKGEPIVGEIRLRRVG